MRYFLCIICLFLLCGLISCRDPIIRSDEIPGYGVIKLRAFKDWEASVPVYMEFDNKKGQKLVSGPFYYAPPDAFDKKKLDLFIGRYNDVIYIKEKKDDDTIIAILSKTKNLVYPPNEIESKQYYAEIEIIFSELKKNIGDEGLKLRR